MVAAKMPQVADRESRNVPETTDPGARGGPLLSWRVNPPLARAGLNGRIPAGRVDVLAGLD